MTPHAAKPAIDAQRNTDPTKKARQSALETALANAGKESAFFYEKMTARMEAGEKERALREERDRERELQEREKEREHQKWLFSILLTGKPPE